MYIYEDGNLAYKWKEDCTCQCLWQGVSSLAPEYSGLYHLLSDEKTINRETDAAAGWVVYTELYGNMMYCNLSWDLLKEANGHESH